MRKLFIILVLVFGLSIPLHYNTVDDKQHTSVNFVVNGNGHGNPDTPVPIGLA